MHLIWTDLLQPGTPYLEKVIRTVAVYIFLFLGLRLGGKRELGQLNPFDIIVLLVLSNTVQNAIIGNDNSLVGGLVGAVVLLLLNYLVVRFLFLHPKFDRLAEGKPIMLIKDGKILTKCLQREMITQRELVSAARRQGVHDLKQVEAARLEVGGALTFILKEPSTEEKRFSDVTARLERIEALLNRMSGPAPAT
ncbi:MAG TPA: YetF domain-containing protein [Gemmatimonadaceae bacterium]|nr:YetF domain-containing protein [Gemmatimonadaceae bacterium]